MQPPAPPARDFTDQIIKSIEGRFHTFERQAFKNLNEVTRDMTRDIRGLNRDNANLQAFRVEGSSRLDALSADLASARDNQARTNRIISAFTFNPRQQELIEVIRDARSRQPQREKALRDLTASVRGAFDTHMHDNTPAGGRLHNINDTKTPEAKMAAAGMDVDPPPPKPAPAPKMAAAGMDVDPPPPKPAPAPKAAKTPPVADDDEGDLKPAASPMPDDEGNLKPAAKPVPTKRAVADDDEGNLKPAASQCPTTKGI